ncbi:ketosamine-3-kinase-like [Glandiceps talaboti]
MDPDHGANVRKKLEKDRDLAIQPSSDDDPVASSGWRFDVTNILKEQMNCGYAEPVGVADSGFVNSGHAFDTDRHGKVFVKMNSGSGARTMFDGEMAGLQAIIATQTITVPTPYRVLDYHDGAILIMKYVEMDIVGKHASKLGELIARMHLHNEQLRKNEEKVANRVGCGESSYVDKFGFDKPTCCGYVPTGNEWCEDWMTFFARQKLQHQIDVIERTHGDRELIELWSQLQRKLPEFFLDVGEIKPALVHGDLTKINVSGNEDEPVVFDPAAFYGHSEYDLASVNMFGGFDSAFFTAYHKLIPKAAGFDRRARLYELFNQFNIWNHFGSAYKDQVLGAMRDLLAM